MKSSSAGTAANAAKIMAARRANAKKGSKLPSMELWNVGRLMGTVGGALVAALVGYLIGFFAGNKEQTPSSTFQRLLTVLPQLGGITGGGSGIQFATGPSMAGCTIQTLFADEVVHGMHLACVQNTPTGLHAMLYVDGQNATLKTVTAPANDFQGLRQMMHDELGLADLGRRAFNGPRGSEIPNTRQPWALFTPQGFPIDTLLDLIEGANDVLLFEGGKFVWPGVRIGHVTQVTELDGLGTLAMRTLSMSPLVFSVDGFLLPEECKYIRDTAEPSLAQSGVALMDKDKGKAATDWRTSSTYFMATRRYPELKPIDRRVSGLTRLPIDHQEDVQVLRYEETQRYDTHHDFFDRRLYAESPNTMELIDNGKRNRFITVLWYLSDVAEGGETIFPLFNGRTRQDQHRDCDLMQGALRSPPKEGRVIMFYSLMPNGDLDDRSLHGSCAVKDGIKYAANKWIWTDKVDHILGH